MKNSIILFALLYISSISIYAQNLTATLNKKGQLNYNGIKVATITKDGGYERNGNQLCRTDDYGNVTDMDGGFVAKGPEGNMFTYNQNGLEDKFTISEPSKNGMCEIKNSEGKTVLQLHKNYKKKAPCAVHCLNHHNTPEPQ